MSCKYKGLLIKCKAEQFINAPENAVIESLKGIAITNSGLIILDGFNAILRRDYNDMPNKVKIISGGGCGNEPTHSGFVGPGMLTAAVFGNVNSAPTIDSIYNVIKELGNHHCPGILLIVQNHPGYVLNFTLAKLRAQTDGIHLRMLVVEDEAKLSKSMEKSRGLLGTLFIHKIAGAMAEKEIELEKIYCTCSKIMLNDLISIGINTKIPTLCSNESNCKEMEIGYGIHGEAGKRRINIMKCHETVSLLILTLLENKGSFSKNNKIAVMINNLGGCSQMEANIFIMEVIQQLLNIGFKISKVYTGNLMTSVNSNGFHVSLLNISEPIILQYLNAHTEAPSWPKSFTAQSLGFNFEYDFSDIIKTGKYVKNAEEELAECSILISNAGPTLEENIAKTFSTIAVFACDALIACAEQVDIIDKDAGDGDCGTSLANGAKAIRNAANNNLLMASKPAIAFSQINRIIQKNMTGLQGGLYSIFFEAVSKVFLNVSETDKITPCLWLRALSEANMAIGKMTCTKEGDRTMLDSLLAAQKAFEHGLSTRSPIQAFGQAVKAAEEQANLSTYATAKVGRASLLENQKFERPDAGAHAVGIWMRATYEGVKLMLSH